ncbi:MAG: PA2169 family four-helix-bundle protein [Caldilineaceae bacterium]|nr:PA2169 family four-helix-bundle protein [Caldilineaceae bacterium]
MSLTNAQIISRLNHLANLNQASEVGFIHAAEHVRNRGLKIYLKNYAAQRARFAKELRDTVVELGGQVTTTANPIAVLHRGWIDIIATLTIGRMNQARVVVQETLRGEQVLLHRYQDNSKQSYSPAIQAMLTEQAEQVQAAHAHLSGIIAYNPNVLLIQLYEQTDTAHSAVSDLLSAGVEASAIQTTPVSHMQRHHHNYQRQLLSESIVACSLLGAIAGILLSLLVVIPLTMGHAAGVDSITYTVPLLIGALIGIGCGMIFGCLIGQANREDDAYFYETGLRDGSVVVSVQAANAPVKLAHRTLEMQRNKERQEESFGMVSAVA